MNKKVKPQGYSAKDIEILEGLEPVRKRPGMYVGGTDDTALHHLISEIFDNSMDEVVAGYATVITVNLSAENIITISDNGRGIPVDPHPKYPDKSALEIILTTLHSGGKFNNNVYKTAGGLHGVGISVVNALSSQLNVKVMKSGQIYSQDFSRGKPVTTLEKISSGEIQAGKAQSNKTQTSKTQTAKAKSKKSGTIISFKPDEQIFKENTKFSPKRVYEFIQSKAYLNKNVTIKWSYSEELIVASDNIPISDIIHYEKGIINYLESEVEDTTAIIDNIFSGETKLTDEHGKIEWAIVFVEGYKGDNISSFCNTIPTPLGGGHENGIKNTLLKGLRNVGEQSQNKKAGKITSEDIISSCKIILSLFITEPEFQGQTKEKLVNKNISKLVEKAIIDLFEHFLTSNVSDTTKLLNYLIEKAEYRLSNKKEKEILRKTVTDKLRLPGKLTDCTSNNQEESELFIVEGDSAGGTAKQARDRKIQAILPLKGKILNVANSSKDKIVNNQELADLMLALGLRFGANYDYTNLRYGKIIIMTDADVDGAHIAALLMTFFLQKLEEIVLKGHLYLALPPLFRITQGEKNYYASSEMQKDKIIKNLSKSRKNIDIGRFKGLGEMNAKQLKETTMNPTSRRLLQVIVNEDTMEENTICVRNVMGKDPKTRLAFIQQKTQMMESLEDKIDI